MHALPRPPAAAAVPDGGDQALEDAVQQGLNLFLKLKNPAQMPALLATIAQQMDAVRDALYGLHYVHYARFLPARDGSVLMVITEYDGDLKSYIMDFVAVMGPIFTAILEFVDGAPRLPVQAYPQDFWDFVVANNLQQAQPWAAYPKRTVIDIQGPRRSTLPPPVAEPAPAPLDLADIQGNILRGWRVRHARHFALRVDNAAAARAFVGLLVSGDERQGPQITTAEHWDERPPYFLNIGFTWDGLRALGLPEATLKLFPEAFRQGPARRAQLLHDDLGEVGRWVLGRPGAEPHLLLSLYTDEVRDEHLQQQSIRLRALFAEYALAELSCHEATALPEGKVHFGYRDGIGQPRIAGVPWPSAPDMQPASSAGEFLLGRDYVNQYGGNFAGDLPHALCDNATYAAVRILAQDVHAFERLIEQEGARWGTDKEWVAAKMMGRWRDGSPLVLAPDAPDPAMGEERRNHFDYAPSAAHPAWYDDFDGLRCPIGSHARRMNPRGALVTGKPHSRRIIRRGMPYGPPFDPARDDAAAVERGLLGLFICGDLEMQFEFLQDVWANRDIATTGLADTRDPLLGAQPPEGGKFLIRTADDRDPITIIVPRLVSTRGSVYLFMPGIGGLRTLASLRPGP